MRKQHEFNRQLKPHILCLKRALDIFSAFVPLQKTTHPYLRALFGSFTLSVKVVCMFVIHFHFPRRNDSGGSAHSAFGPLLPNGTPSQLVPK